MRIHRLRKWTARNGHSLSSVSRIPATAPRHDNDHRNDNDHDHDNDNDHDHDHDHGYCSEITADIDTDVDPDIERTLTAVLVESLSPPSETETNCAPGSARASAIVAILETPITRQTVAAWLLTPVRFPGQSGGSSCARPGARSTTDGSEDAVDSSDPESLAPGEAAKDPRERPLRFRPLTFVALLAGAAGACFL